MNASDIMTTPVISVEPDTPVQEIAALLIERHISGVPVVDNGRVVGLVNARRCNVERTLRSYGKGDSHD